MSQILKGLNPEQQKAVAHGDNPLLIIAGAGTGKTTTLVHRVAHLIERGIAPNRIMLLTFTRRAAAEMLSRVDILRRQLQKTSSTSVTRPAHPTGQVWGGTFHATATRILRLYGRHLGLADNFTIQDRSDSEDLLDVVRTELNLAKADRLFPKKGTCLEIYSACINTQQPLEKVLEGNFPWCRDHAAGLKQLFQAYTDRKAAARVLDYDDLLLFWHAGLSEPRVAKHIRDRFDCVLVDEYQDTNRLQSEIVRMLRPKGTGITIVGDDAQAIYGWRGASVRNILDFPQQFPETTIVKLEQNYRSTQPILAATNAIIAQAKQRYQKELWSKVEGENKPCLVTCADEGDQADCIVRQVIENREAGIDLRKQAILFRASSHSIPLEAALARHGIPFVKYGGLKFVEAAHVKDLLAFLRLAENYRDVVSGIRLLKLIPGIGSKKAQQLMQMLITADGDLPTWSNNKVPSAAAGYWSKFIQLLTDLRKSSDRELPSQVNLVRKYYQPLLEVNYDHTQARLQDLEQLEQLAARFRSRARMLSDLTLDPPNSTQDLAGDPLQEEDYLVLSTIHSAKGLEWEAVSVINAVDGNIPSDRATESDEQIDEELRLFYVALTRAKRSLTVYVPLSFYHSARGPLSDQHSYAQRSRFIPESVLKYFDRRGASHQSHAEDEISEASDETVVDSVRHRIRSMWS